MNMSAIDQTAQNLEDRIGRLYDLGALAEFFHVSRRALRRRFQQEGIPVIEVGRKHLVQQELVDKALGLDFAELLLELRRNEAWMRERELHADGRRKTVVEYAQEMSAVARQALQATAEADQR